MRKLSAIMLALLLVSGVAMAQVTVSGTVDYTTLTSGDADDAVSEFEVDLKFTAAVDDFNTAVVKLEQNNGTLPGEPMLDIDEAYFDTDWAGALGLGDVAPVGLDSRAGYWELDIQNYGTVTGLEVEDIDTAGNQAWAGQLVVSALDLVNLQVSVAPGPPEGNNQILIGLYGGGEFDFGTVNAEIFVSDNSETLSLGEGAIIFGTSYSGEVVPDLLDLAVGGEFMYHLDKDVLPAPLNLLDWAYGLGVSGTALDAITLGLGLFGTSEAAAAGMGVDLGLSYMDLLAFDLGVVLAIDDTFGLGLADQETLNYLEASVAIMPGAATFRIGYMFDGADDATAGQLDTAYKAGGDGLSALGDVAESAIFLRSTIGF